MALEIKHVQDLKGLQFRIPSYQRGYRWERKQIEQLLNDLAEFADSIEEARNTDCCNKFWNQKNQYSTQRPTDNEQNLGYYCLQPLVVTRNGEKYDLIDGQQRLTTIYLISCYLETIYGDDMAAPYSLEFETRNNEFLKEKKFAEDNEESLSNIDFYFMTQGYKVIKEWFEDKPENKEKIKNLIKPNNFQYNREKEEYNMWLHDIRFIWYETEAASSIKTFNNLNYGKIGLTAAELVKALLLECDRYEYSKREIERGIAFARSTKWSAMEEQLQNKFFWGMLSPTSDASDLHLELILSFVAHDIDAKYKYSEQEKWVTSDKDWIFNIFSKAITDNNLCDDKNESLSSVTQRVEYLWNCIEKIYTVFCNWFEDRSLYHRIGLYIFLSTHYSNKKHKDIIKELYCLYKNNLKTNFVNELRTRIGEVIKITATITEGENKRKKTLDELRYGEDDNTIRKILLAFNVEQTLSCTHESPRFPFHLADEIDLKSIEHIHPQNLDDDNIGYADFKNWFKSRRKILENNCQPNDGLKQAIELLEEHLSSDETFKKNKSDCLKYLAEVDKNFDELAGMNHDEMHSLRNLALVDGRTNTALSNNLLDVKRNILIDKSTNEDIYAPLGTLYAFNKHFTQQVEDLKFWTHGDREAYFAEIERVYKFYTENL